MMKEQAVYAYENMHPTLRKVVGEGQLFDSYRLVNPRTHRVFDYAQENDELVQDNDLCFAVWHRHAPCMNCTAKSCRALHTEMMKIEYLEGRMLLVISLPVEVEGLPFALELIKDVTESLLVADVEQHDNIDITYMVNRFNELAVRDSFTTLYNKTYIKNELENLIERAAQGDEQAMHTTVIEFDVDRFKAVNDTYGHSTGDDVLLYTAKQLKHIAHQFDGWAGRLGGDEFIVCVPGGLSDTAMADLMSQVKKIESYSFSARKRNFSITFSWGASSFEADESYRAFMDRIDQAMYERKKATTLDQPCRTD